MKSYTDSQKQALDKRRLKPVYLIEITLQNSGPVLYFSDRNITVGSQIYENYLESLSGLGRQLRRRNSETLNLDIDFTFKNQRYKNYSFLIEIGDTYPFEGAETTIKKVYLDDDNTPSDVEIIEKVVLDEPSDIDLMSFNCKASAVPYAKDELWKQNTINKTDYPNADPDDLNKVLNIIYGAHEKIRCQAIAAGAVDSLQEDITASAPGDGGTFDLSDASEFPSAGAFTVQLADEQIRCSSRSGNTLTVATGGRGYNGTTAVDHEKGEGVFEVLTEYVYLVADHPVKSIGDIYVDGVRYDTGFTKYTGQSGDEHSSYTGKAVLVFTAKPVISKQVIINDGIGVTDDIDFTSAGALKTVYANGSSGPSNHANARDGNTNTRADSGTPSVKLTVSFPSTDHGSITTQYIWARNVNNSSGLTVVVGGGWSPGTFNSSGDFRFSKSGGSWGDSITFERSGGSISNFVGEVEKEVEYTPNLTKSGSASKTGTVTGSSADVVIGNSVNVDVDGYQDDGSGTYTGSANALIERPDHVRKHFIDVLYGFTLSDIDSPSFNAAGSSYASAISGGYKFAIVIDKEIKPSKFLQELDFQSRSTCRYRAGKWYLDYLPDTAPTADKIISRSQLAGQYAQFIFNKTDRMDILNDIEARFKKNHGRLKYDESEWLSTSKASDSTSQTKYGIRPSKPGQFDFWMIRSQTMADHITAFILLQNKNALLTVAAPVFWENLDLEDGDTFDISNDLYNSKKFYIEEIQYINKFQGQLIGLEWW